MAFLTDMVLRKYIPEPGISQVVVPEGITRIGECAFLQEEGLCPDHRKERHPHQEIQILQLCATMWSFHIQKVPAEKRIPPA